MKCVFGTSWIKSQTFLKFLKWTLFLNRILTRKHNKIHWFSILIAFWNTYGIFNKKNQRGYRKSLKSTNGLIHKNDLSKIGVKSRKNIQAHCVKSVRIQSFLVRIFPHSDWIWGDITYLSVFSPNARKYGPQKLRLQTLYAVNMMNKLQGILASFLPMFLFISMLFIVLT